jgi:hypothetical protein
LNQLPPTLLVLGDYPIGYANGVGETLANLLTTYPENRLFQAHPSHHQARPGTARGRSLAYTTPLRPKGLSRVLSPLYYPILKFRQMLAARRLFHSLAGWVREHDIRAVLTYPINPWVLFASVRLRRAFPNVRFIFYVMDDWQGHHEAFGLPYTRRRQQALAEMIELADVRFACSHLMARDYESRFGSSWGVLHKGVPCAVEPSATHTLHRFSTILYAGAINVFRLDAMLAFAEGLGLFRQQTGRDVRLEILGKVEDPSYVAALAPFDFIKVEPWVDNETCQRRMATADLLYLPLAFSPKLERISNLAMPTKFSEYLASGRPTLFHVPRESEVQALATRAQLPLTLNSLQPQEVCDLLRRIERDGVDVLGYQAKVQQLLRDEFDEVKLRERLHYACMGAQSC